MAFFLIVPSVMIVTIFLVHSAAERLGFKAKYSSLILCAIMALLVNIAAIEMSTYLDKWYYVKLGALVFFASIIVTLVNRYLIRHERSDIVIIDDIDDELALIGARSKEQGTSEAVADKELDPRPLTLAPNKTLDPIKAHLGSLDDILDYAYAQKTKGDLSQAILAYQKALDRYRSDDYAPFIAIDLGNIYKEQAAYSKVIKTYEEALMLPVVMRNADTRKEFNKNLTYMKIVQSVLIRHRALTMPFSKIPKQYLQEVETEFKALQLNHSTVQKRY